MIINWRNNNSVEELHIGLEPRVQGHICYRNGDWRVSVTSGGCPHGVEERGCEQAQGGIQMGSKSGIDIETRETTAEQSRSIACNKIEID